MRFLVIMAALMTLSCNAREPANTEYEMTCVKVNKKRPIYRCENKEAICYRTVGYDSLAMQCFFKHIPRVKPMENK